MKRFHLSRPSPALIVSVVALVIALSGVAVGLPGKNSVDKGDIKKNAVTTKKIKKGAVKAAKIADGAVTTAKLGNSAVTSGKIADGAVTSGKFFLASVTTLDFGNQPGPSCDSRNVSAPGIQPTDFVVVTPPPGFPNTFTLEGHPVTGGNAVAMVSCNTFDGGGAVDPDGPTGGPYKLLVIR